MFYIDHKPILVNENTKIDNFNPGCIKFMYLDLTSAKMINENSKILSHVSCHDTAYLYEIRFITKYRSIIKEDIIRYLSAYYDTNKYHDDLMDVNFHISPRPFKIEKQYSRINKIRSFI